jgi:hypothetical protein
MTNDNMYPAFKRHEDGSTLTMTIDDNRDKKIADLETTIRSLMKCNDYLRCCGNCRSWEDDGHFCNLENEFRDRTYICDQWELPEDWR